VAADRRKLVGERGTVLRALRPSGLVELDGERVEVVSEGEFIDAGAEVEVVRVAGRDIVVRAAEKE
jgi:membrane-bound serine protease (ClpP class)